MPVLFGGHNLPPMVKIGFTDKVAVVCLFNGQMVENAKCSRLPQQKERNKAP